MTCPHDSVSLPSTSDPQTVCADCGQVLAESDKHPAGSLPGFQSVF